MDYAQNENWNDTENRKFVHSMNNIEILIKSLNLVFFSKVYIAFYKSAFEGCCTL